MSFVTWIVCATLSAANKAGARSPQLWNAAFLDHGIDSLMHPFDIDAEDLPHLMEALNLDKLILPEANTVPHKH